MPVLPQARRWRKLCPAARRRGLSVAGARLLSLPVYSPDLDPLEPCWSKIKTHLRKVKARTLDLLYNGLAEGLRLVTARDIRGWFTHCVYNFTPVCKPVK